MEDQKHEMHPVKDVYVIDQPQSLSYKPHAKGQRTSTDLWKLMSDLPQINYWPNQWKQSKVQLVFLYLQIHPSTGKLKFKDSYFKAFKVVLEGVNIRTSTAIKEWILDTKWAHSKYYNRKMHAGLEHV